MPWLLYRYILGDLLRVFALTSAILVIVIAFGATLKPLTSEGAIGAMDAIKYMAFAIVPMLQFALPFAAGFASTMVLHRMANDNEILAAAASGISYRKLLAPIVLTGVVLTLVMVVLMNWTIPRFWGMMERIIAADITRIFESSINSGSAFQVGNLQIHADSMRVVTNPSDTQADTRFILFGVTAAELDDHGRVEMDVTARQAVADIYRLDDQSYVKLILADVVGYDGGAGQLARSEFFEPPNAIHIPSVFRDELRTKSRNDLLKLRERPDGYRPVVDGKTAIARALDHEQVAQRLSSRLRDHGQVEIEQAAPSRRRYVIKADRMRGPELLRSGGPIEVLQYHGTMAMRRIAAERALLTRASDAADDIRFTLSLERCEVTDLQHDGMVNRRERLVDQNLLIPGLQLVDLSAMTSAELIERGRQEREGSAAWRAANQLDDRIQELILEIDARLMKRHAQSLTTLLLLTLGAVFAMLMRGGLPLVVYVWAFAPSVLTLILASGGDKMMRDGDIYAGAAVMWSGNAAMLLLLFVTYARLRRN